MTDDISRDQSNGRSDGGISRRTLVTGTLMTGTALAASGVTPASLISSAAAQAAGGKKPNIVILMTDDTGWGDFGYISGGGEALGHPTPNIDRLAKEGAIFTNWYGQASCTAGRASFITGRIPIRSALSVVVVPGDPNGLRKETPTIAEFFKKNGYQTYFSGKWHLGDKPEFYPIEHGFDVMKNFAAYYPGVYSYSDTSPRMSPLVPKIQREILADVPERRELIRVGRRGWQARDEVGGDYLRQPQ